MTPNRTISGQKNTRWGTLVLCTILAVTAAGAEEPRQALEGLEKLQSQIQQTLRNRKDSVVALVNADGISAGSTAVIVSPEGFVLTASHTVLRKEECTLIMDDGRPLAAKVLGWNRQSDAAMLQITEPAPAGGWPHSPLREAEEPMRPGEWVISLSHSRGYDPNRDLPVKTGIVGIQSNENLIQTTCLITGGDSGGPLYDLQGRLIGIHSYIGEHLHANYHVKVESIRRDWPKMMQSKRWGISPLKALPLKPTEPTPSPEPGKKNLPEIPKDPRLERMSEKELQHLVENKPTPVPTLLCRGQKFGNAFALPSTTSGETRFLAKWAELEGNANELELEFNGRKIRTVVERSFIEHDLVVLRLLSNHARDVFPEPTKPVLWRKEPVAQGELLFAINQTGIAAIGTASIRARNSTRNGAPYLGITVEPESNGLRVNSITPGSPAQQAGIQKDDLLKSLCNQTLSHPLQLRRRLYLEKLTGETPPEAQNPSEINTSTITFSRNGKTITETILLNAERLTPAPEENLKLETMDQMGAILSKGRKTHTVEIESDMPLPAAETGCPVINIKGEIIGIGISRRDRTTTTIVPTTEILRLTQTSPDPEK
jgi:S1-C subfamily serine protease